MRFLVSSGEASGDLYASGTVAHLKRAFPQATFYGCAGPRLQAAGVTPVLDAGRISVVGLAEVVGHLPRIYGDFRRLVAYAQRNVPDAALLTDSPDFNLRLARKIKGLGVPIFYLVAPQVWAWRQSRVKTIRELVDKLFCLFPFEERWFRERGVNATYIGHPLANMVRAGSTTREFRSRHGLPSESRIIALLPGSRPGEIARHLPILLETAALLQRHFELSFVLATPRGFQTASVFARFRERMHALSIQVIENETWDCIAHATLALAASGTVTMEAAVLGTPMVTFYKVNPLSWYAGRRLVKAPFLSMVNLIAEKEVVPELIQQDMTPEKLAAAATRLLSDQQAIVTMRTQLAGVRQLITTSHDPLEYAARLIAETMHARFHSLPSRTGDVLQETIN